MSALVLRLAASLQPAGRQKQCQHLTQHYTAPQRYIQPGECFLLKQVLPAVQLHDSKARKLHSLTLTAHLLKVKRKGGLACNNMCTA